MLLGLVGSDGKVMPGAADDKGSRTRALVKERCLDELAHCLESIVHVDGRHILPRHSLILEHGSHFDARDTALAQLFHDALLLVFGQLAIGRFAGRQQAAACTPDGSQATHTLLPQGLAPLRATRWHDQRGRGRGYWVSWTSCFLYNALGFVDFGFVFWVRALGSCFGFVIWVRDLGSCF